MKLSTRKKASYQDACTSTDVCIMSDASVETDLLNGGLDVSVQADVYVACDACTTTDDSSTKTDAAFNIVIVGHDISIDASVPDDCVAREADSTEIFKDTDLSDMANVDVECFNFPNLSIPEMKLLHLKLNNEEVFTNLVSFLVIVRDIYPRICF